MLTPLDIQNKAFKKEMRGYSTQEVEDFLNLVIADYEKLYKDNIDLRSSVDKANDALKQYKAMEDTLQSALVTAQGTSEQVQQNANAKAQNIIRDAENRYHQIINTAHEEVRKITYKYEEMKRQLDIYRVKMTVLVESQLDMLNKVGVSGETLTQISGVEEALQQFETPPEDKQSIEEFLSKLETGKAE